MRVIISTTKTHISVSYFANRKSRAQTVRVSKATLEVSLIPIGFALGWFGTLMVI